MHSIAFVKTLIRILGQTKPLWLMIMMVWANASMAVELVLGEKRVDPGIVFIFEGAVKDQIIPQTLHLAEKKPKCI